MERCRFPRGERVRGAPGGPLLNPWDDPRVRAGFRRQLARRRDELADGAEGIGWKVGFGSPSALDLMRLEAPLLGYLTDRRVLEDATILDVSDWQMGVIEFEVAAWIGTSLGSGTTPREARAAVRAVGPAIEVADVGFAPGPEAVEEILAVDIFHRGVLLGTADEGRAGIDLDGLTAVVEVDGALHAETSDLEALTGRLDEVVATVANTLGAFGERLEEGAVIITGAVIPPIRLDDATSFAYRLGGHPPLTVHRAP